MTEATNPPSTGFRDALPRLCQLGNVYMNTALIKITDNFLSSFIKIIYYVLVLATYLTFLMASFIFIGIFIFLLYLPIGALFESKEHQQDYFDIKRHNPAPQKPLLIPRNNKPDRNQRPENIYKIAPGCNIYEFSKNNKPLYFIDNLCHELARPKDKSIIQDGKGLIDA